VFVGAKHPQTPQIWVFFTSTLSSYKKESKMAFTRRDLSGQGDKIIMAALALYESFGFTKRQDVLVFRKDFIDK
jgi:hypothetical protein